MKQFYLCTMVHNLNSSNRKREWIEYDINTSIHNEAEYILECDDTLSELPDDEFFALVDKKAKEITEELINNGIYRDELGQPLFLYC